MDLCDRFDVHGQNCLYVTGVEETCDNEDIARIFEAHGEIEKVVRVPDEPQQPAGRVLIQYLSEKSILRISPDFLGVLPNPKDPAMTWHVRTVRDLHQQRLGRELALRHLDELNAIPGSGRAEFQTFPPCMFHQVQCMLMKVCLTTLRFKGLFRSMSSIMSLLTHL